MAYKVKRKIGDTLWRIFQDNERRYLHYSDQKPLTDAEILSILMKFFPESDGVKSMIIGRLSINRYRSMINRGLYFKDRPPMWPPSFRYNKQGKRVSGRSGIRVLTAQEQKDIITELKSKQPDSKEVDDPQAPEKAVE